MRHRPHSFGRPCDLQKPAYRWSAIRLTVSSPIRQPEVSLSRHFRTPWAMVMTLAICSPASGATQPDSEQSFLGVRVLKKTEGAVPWSVQLPPECKACELVDNQYSTADTKNDFFFHFYAPRNQLIVRRVHITIDPAYVRGVLVGRSHVPFRRVQDGIVFDVHRDDPTCSTLPSDERLPVYGGCDASDNHTYIITRGVALRVEHADERRRRGPYASGRWPALERQAALNLEFGTRSAIEALGLGETVARLRLGTILLMGFDTYWPTRGPDWAHEDDPPHWHMHMAWRVKPVLRKIGHFYIGSNGQLIDNESQDMSRKGPDATKRLERGGTDTTIDNRGQVLYRQTIARNGDFVLSSPTGICTLSPVADGFQSGVQVICDRGKYTARINAIDDIARGRIKFFVNGALSEEYTYDSDTGILKN
jgi:hypothetical protein